MTPDKDSLTPEQVDIFHNEGYLLIDQVFTEDDFQPAIDEINTEVDRRATILVERGELSRTYVEEGFERQLARISQENDKVTVSIWHKVLHGLGIFHLLSHPRLLDLVEALCGPEIIASSVHRLRPKIPNYGFGVVPWHQDSGYFEPYCDSALVETVWVPLVNATEENGCLWLIPKSHCSPIVKHDMNVGGWYLEIAEEDLPAGKPVPCPVPKGSVLFMHNHLAHSSYNNTTEDVRWSMDFRYQSASLPTNAAITRLEGEDVASVETGVPAACYPPEADFLVRSQKRPDEVIKTLEAFYHLRENHEPADLTNRWGVKWPEPIKESF